MEYYNIWWGWLDEKVKLVSLHVQCCFIVSRHFDRVLFQQVNISLHLSTVPTREVVTCQPSHLLTASFPLLAVGPPSSAPPNAPEFPKTLA